MRFALLPVIAALVTVPLALPAPAQVGGAAAGATPAPGAGGAAAAGAASAAAGAAAGGKSAAGSAAGATGAAAGGAKAGAAGPKLPDLVVTMGAGNPFPSSFTVRNQGAGQAGVSVLKVSATLLPLEIASLSGCPPAYKTLCDARAAEWAAALTPEKVRSMCGNPFPEVLEAIPTLGAGAAATVSHDTSRFGHVSVNLAGAVAAKPGTHVSFGVTTLVCAFDVVARADASNQVSEVHEDNNAATARVTREIRLE